MNDNRSRLFEAKRLLGETVARLEVDDDMPRDELLSHLRDAKFYIASVYEEEGD